MTASRIPFTAYDPRLITYWRAGVEAPITVAEVPEDLDDATQRARSNQLIKLSQLLHEVRTAAKRDRIPGWESLFSAIQRKTYRSTRLVGIRIEPRSIATSALLGLAAPPPLAPTTTAAAPAPTSEPVPVDILADLFGPLGT